MAVGCSGFFQNPLITHYTLHLLLDSGLDVCGLRLLYPPQRLLSESGTTQLIPHVLKMIQHLYFRHWSMIARSVFSLCENNVRKLFLFLRSCAS